MGYGTKETQIDSVCPEIDLRPRPGTCPAEAENQFPDSH